MKGFISGLIVMIIMSGFTVKAAEPVRTIDANEPYVVEPIFEANNWNCPRHTKVIAKYCWDAIYGSFMTCGYVCHPVNHSVPGGHSPTNP